MRAGILTFHQEDNYGAVLQAYALQRKLEILGIENEFLDIEVKRREKTGLSGVQMPSSPAMVLLQKRITEGAAQRSALFEAFRKKHFRLTPVIPQVEAAAWAERFDVLISGSDQVWNPLCHAFDMRYFQPFVPKNKRCSYAASLGQDLDTSPHRDLIVRSVASFRTVSVREESAKDFLAKATGRDDIQVSLDPTLLLDPGDYDSLLLKEGIEEEGHVTLFMVSYDKELHMRAMAEARKRNLPLRCVTAGFMPQMGMEAWAGVSPEKWLTLIHNAALVLTNSFHGLVMSLMFSRPLILSHLKGNLAERNGRITELLHLIGLDHPGEEIPPMKPEVLRKRLEGARVASVQYLESLKEL